MKIILVALICILMFVVVTVSFAIIEGAPAPSSTIAGSAPDYDDFNFLFWHVIMPATHLSGG